VIGSITATASQIGSLETALDDDDLGTDLTDKCETLIHGESCSLITGVWTLRPSL